MATVTTPPDVAEDVLYEVVDGQVVEKPPMGVWEGEIATLLARYLGTFAETNQLGKVLVEVLFRIDPVKKRERRPDVAFVAQARWPYDRRTPRVAAWDMVPDLAIEVVSPSNSASQVQSKIQDYFQAGVQRVWVVYPDTFQVYDYEAPTRVNILQSGDELDAAPLLTGFRLPLNTLFGKESS